MDNIVEKVWNKFWKKIVSNDDGSLNLEQVKKELYDFYFMINEVPKVYSEITNGTLSKPMYSANTVLSVFNDYNIDKECAKDDMLELLDGLVDKDIIEEIKNYFS